MSETPLNSLSYVVLALVGNGGASAHDLARMVKQGSPGYWDGATSKVYAEPKRLARLGYLDASTVPGRTTPRTIDAITTSGRAALAQRLAEPATFPRIKNEAHLRLLAGDMIDDATIVESFRAMRPEVDRLDALIDQMLAQADDFPHRARYLRINHAYAKQLVAVHRAWVDNVDRALGPTGTNRDARVKSRAHTNPGGRDPVLARSAGQSCVRPPDRALRPEFDPDDASVDRAPVTDVTDSRATLRRSI